MNENHSLDYDRLDNLRKELEGKIAEKAPDGVFKWVVGGLAASFVTAVTLLWTAFGAVHETIQKNVSTADQQFQELKQRVTTIETTLNQAEELSQKPLKGEGKKS